MGRGSSHVLAIPAWALDSKRRREPPQSVFLDSHLPDLVLAINAEFCSRSLSEFVVQPSASTKRRTAQQSRRHGEKLRAPEISRIIPHGKKSGQWIVHKFASANSSTLNFWARAVCYPTGFGRSVDATAGSRSIRSQTKERAAATGLNLSQSCDPERAPTKASG